MQEKLKRFINFYSEVHIVNEVVSYNLLTGKLINNYEVKCILSNGKVKTCLVNKKIFESINDSVKWM